jgi:hypothetical protein
MANPTNGTIKRKEAAKLTGAIRANSFQPLTELAD